MDATLKHTPFFDLHKEKQARFAPFAGWQMPIQYADGAISEHKHVRAHLGVFDTSHMGRFEVRGSDAAAFLDYAISSDILTLDVNASRYGLLCRQDGGILDDVFAYRLADHFFVVVNASNLTKDYEHLDTLRSNFDVELEDRSGETVMLAVQGPDAIPFLNTIASAPLSEIPRFGAAYRTFAGVEALVGRTGYTGEDGAELFFPSIAAQQMWQYLFSKASSSGFDLRPIGLAARDSLRFEPGFPLYGHELSEDVNPIQARLKWACEFDRTFVGRDALLEHAKSVEFRKLATVILRDRGVPREGCTVYNPEHGGQIGVVVTGMYAPTVDAYAANVYLENTLSKVGTMLEIDIRGKRKTAEVVKRPLYTPSYR
ncbi:MAG: glycine cleavage system aminomethyltransferase GcvT [Spirochaetia bacterium]